MNEMRKQKKKKKKILADQTKPSPAGHPLAQHRAVAKDRRMPCGPKEPATLFSFHLSFRFFKTYLYSNMNISSYTIPFLDPFVSTRS
jgi:hypothetical protein